MALRPESIKSRLARLDEVTSRLRSIDPGLLESESLAFWAAERGLQLGAEILLDIGAHLLASHFGDSPENYEDILAGLARRQVLPGELYKRLRGLGGFRNILVHDYLRLEPEKVGEALRNAPADFEDFSRAVREWLAAAPPPP